MMQEARRLMKAMECVLPSSNGWDIQSVLMSSVAESNTMSMPSLISSGLNKMSPLDLVPGASRSKQSPQWLGLVNLSSFEILFLAYQTILCSLLNKSKHIEPPRTVVRNEYK